MKLCTKCNEKKDVSQFNKNRSRKDGLQSKCRDCDRGRAKKYFHQNKVKLMTNISRHKRERVIRDKVFINEYLKNNPCIDCGETNLVVLDFDHVKGQKFNAVGQLATSGYSIEVIKNEIQKCEVRCANCHRIKTAKERNYYGYLAEMD